MPWQINNHDGRCPVGEPFAVVRSDTDELVACHMTEAQAKDHMAAMYTNEPTARESAPDLKAPIEFRAAKISNIDFKERVITVVAVPYEDPAVVEYRGEIWKEVFERTAFNGIENKHTRVPVYLFHDPKFYVGQAQKFYPSRPEGLVTELRMFDTPDGKDTLTKAAEDGFSSSIAFSVRGSDQVLNRRTMTRRIKRAFVVEHIALVPQPAYENARVLSVRDPALSPDAQLPKLRTPALDEYLSAPVVQWIADRNRRQ